MVDSPRAVCVIKLDRQYHHVQYPHGWMLFLHVTEFRDCDMADNNLISTCYGICKHSNARAMSAGLAADIFIVDSMPSSTLLLWGLL